MTSGRAFALRVLCVAAVVCIFAILLGTPQGKNHTTSVQQGRTLETAFTPPEQGTSENVFAKTPYTCGNDFECAGTYLKNIASVYGPDIALAILEGLQQKGAIAKSVDDHQLAHQVGRKTAERFGVNGKAFNLCPTTFNYGCQHGYFEYVLGKTDTPKEAATLICESLDPTLAPKSKFYCYHGVGHGVMMARANDLREALNVCDSFDNATAQGGCWQGVFMENVNAGMRGEARAGVFSDSDPLAPCDTVETKYQHECFINHAGWLMRVFGNDIGKGSFACLKAPDPFISTCIQSLGLMVTNPSWQDGLYRGASQKTFEQKAVALCNQFPKQYQKDCIVAGVDNIINFDQLTITRAQQFCSAVADVYRSTCYRQIGSGLTGQTVDKSIIQARCAMLSGNAAADCFAGAGIIQ